MIKFVSMIILIFFMFKKNLIISFYYNLCFMMSFMMIFLYYNNEMYIMVSSYMSVDFYSYVLILMSLWIMGLLFMTLSSEMEKKMEVFLFLMLNLCLFFSMSNLILFYFFFELSLIPTYMLVVYWGYNPERLNAAYYMLMYTFFISLPLLIYIMMLYKNLGSFDLSMLMMMKIELSLWGYMMVMGAFFIKMPMFFFHIWLPKAHVEAPVYGSMILAAILLKLGSYGLLRFLKIFLVSSLKFNKLFMAIGILGSLLISLVCLVQVDMKSLVAYSSVVHMNLMLCSLMSLYKLGFLSAYIIMISHGLCSSGLFYMVNTYYYRSSSRLLLMNKGMINLMPSFTLWWFMLCSSNFSFPMSIGFIGEIYFLSTMISWNFNLIILLILISFISSAYSLYLFSMVQHGEIQILNKFNSGSMKEIMVMLIHYFPMMVMLLNLVYF